MMKNINNVKETIFHIPFPIPRDLFNLCDECLIFSEIELNEFDSWSSKESSLIAWLFISLLMFLNVASLLAKVFSR